MDKQSRSFIARLYMVTNSYHGQQRVGVTVTPNPGFCGWLKPMIGLEEISKPINFFFHFLEKNGEGELTRIHCDITCSSATEGHRGAKLGVSRNGYAGLYQVAEVEDFWKLEPLNDWQDDQNLLLNIRNPSGFCLGKQVFTKSEYPVDLLNILDGENMSFRAQVLKWL